MTTWERVPGPAAVVRAALPGGVAGPAPLADSLPEILADATAGLAARFTAVRAIHAEASAHEVHLVHSAIAPDGEGIVIETRLDRQEAVSCWVSPMHRYLVDRAAARRAMAGRTRRAAEPADPPGVPIAEAWLDLNGTVFAVRRRGPLVECAGGTFPASTLPAWLAEAVALAPRPAPERVELVLGVPDDLDGATRWRLDWIIGRDDTPEPADEDWSTARVTAGGTLEVIDRGPAYPLLRLLDELPGPLAADAREADPTGECVGLVPITPAEVFALLAALAT